MASCPAVLVAAPASGQGKTTVACALARLHVRQGALVRSDAFTLPERHLCLLVRPAVEGTS